MVVSNSLVAGATVDGVDVDARTAEAVGYRF
jgi:hypothetical protein